MLNLFPRRYRSDDEVRVLNNQDRYPRRLWWDPSQDLGPSEREREKEDNLGYDIYYNPDPDEDYPEKLEADPTVSTQVMVRAEILSSPPSPRYFQAPTYSTVSEFSIVNGFNLREAALVALGGAGAALVLLLIMAGVFVARRRKNSPSPAPSPPILVYPPHDVTAPCFLTKEVNFSLPALRSSSLGELRDVSVSSLASEVLCPPTSPQYRSNSFSEYHCVPPASLGELRDVSVSSLASEVLCPPTSPQYRSSSFSEYHCVPPASLGELRDVSVPSPASEVLCPPTSPQYRSFSEYHCVPPASLGELRDVSVPSLASEVLCPPTSPQYRSNSFTNTADLGVLDPSLYKADILVEDQLWPDGHVGRVWFTLKYDATTERLQVHIIKVKHLPSRTPALANACDPYIKIQLVPDERRVLQTKQKKKTCNPFYDETFVYQIPPNKLETLTLKLSVMDTGRVGRSKQLVGHVILPLSELDGAAADEEPQLYKLDIEKELQEPVSDLGEILVSLLYNENLNRLTVTVIEARGLKLDPTSTRREVITRVTQERACRGVRARRTAAVEVTEEGSADISECFHFRLRADELHTTSVTIQALQPHSSYAKDRILGKFVLGSYMFTRGRALQHWNSAIASPMEQVKQWHPLTN
ncbi:synaptotagmin-15-like [Aricia agestis]|uniref:synaptotagmin-15-like n=1 Tax=Aricia agestis TaxID=91739 RepID=UPI001C2051D7|nr:synaptotagmin-15-like [Aricia agestis]